MTRLKYIEFEFDNVLGLYGKDIKETIKLDGTIAEHMILTQNAGDDLYDEDLWLLPGRRTGSRQIYIYPIFVYAGQVVYG